MKYAKSFLTICLFFSFLAVYSQNNNEQLEAKLDSLFQTTMYEQRIPGATVIIVKDGQTLLKKDMVSIDWEKKSIM